MSDNWIEIFGAVTGIIYVFLEIRQNQWLWPVGIITSAVYIMIFFSGKLYADMSLQVYYLVISVVGWYWWIKGTGHRAKGTGQRVQGKEYKAQGTEHRTHGSDQKSYDSPLEGGQGDVKLKVSNLKFRTGLILAAVFILLYFTLWFVLSRLTDSPVPQADSFITSLSIIATWMLARKIYEHWYLWIVVNSASVILFLTRGLIPTVFLYTVYLIMSFAGLKAWKKMPRKPQT
jgi:nicotinamide mononucleotide transporter